MATQSGDMETGTAKPNEPGERPSSSSHGSAPGDGRKIPPKIAGTLFSLPKRKLYQDEIYGSKELAPLAIAIIDTPEFQRLGQIYQLGMTYTVFRAGNHRRLDHSIGTYFMSRTLMRRIVQNHARFYDSDPAAFEHPGRWLSRRFYVAAPGTPGEQFAYSAMGRWRGLIEIVSAAALLHDLGHIAVGHTLEDEFSVYPKHDGLGNSRLFQLLYGPRAVQHAPDSGRPIDRFFAAIDQDRLPRPRDTVRAPLPWIFEDGLYPRFLPDAGGDAAEVKGFANWEIRDLLYLILSFKETITRNEYRTFSEELADGLANAEDEHHKRRLMFIEYLYRSFALPQSSVDDMRPIFQPFMADIVGNTICADLLDYLVRDGKRLHLEIRNNPRLQRYLVVRPDSSFDSVEAADANLRLTINAVYRNGMPRRDTISDLIDLMRERYRFAEVVYYHPKKCAFSTMIAKALEIAKEARPGDQNAEIYPAPWHPVTGKHPRATVPHVVHLGDEGLLAYLYAIDSAKSGPVSELVRGISYRDEYRLLFTLDWDAAQKSGNGPEKFKRALRSDGDAERKKWEVRFTQLVRSSPLNRGLVDELPPILIYCPNLKMQVKEVAARVELVPNQIVTLNRQGHDTPLAQEIEALNEKYKALWRLYLFAHPSLTVGRGDADYDVPELLSSIVDAFCESYGVGEDSRRRGSRFAYVPFRERMARQFATWRGRLSSTNKRIVEERAEDLCLRLERAAFWRCVLGRDASYPVTESEYVKGFEFAVFLAALDGASPRHREAWPIELSSLRESQWHTPADSRKTEAFRSRAVALLLDSRGALFDDSAKLRGKAADWASLVELTSSLMSKLSS